MGFHLPQCGTTTALLRTQGGCRGIHAQKVCQPLPVNRMRAAARGFEPLPAHFKGGSPAIRRHSTVDGSRAPGGLPAPANLQGEAWDVRSPCGARTHVLLIESEMSFANSSNGPRLPPRSKRARAFWILMCYLIALPPA